MRSNRGDASVVKYYVLETGVVAGSLEVCCQ